jgi:AcrR family transcriptional regulator
MEPTLLKPAYLDYLRRHGRAPKTVFAFADAQGISEGEFYRHYASFAVIDREAWAEFGREARAQATQEPAWQGYGAREKLLAFYYTLLEILKNNRSFVLLTLGRSQRRQPALVPKVLSQFEAEFKDFVQEILHEGRTTGEVASRPCFEAGNRRNLNRPIAVYPALLRARRVGQFRAHRRGGGEGRDAELRPCGPQHLRFGPRFWPVFAAKAFLADDRPTPRVAAHFQGGPRRPLCQNRL